MPARRRRRSVEPKLREGILNRNGLLNFYINRAGSHLPAKQKNVLIRAKGELKKAFGRT